MVLISLLRNKNYPFRRHQYSYFGNLRVFVQLRKLCKLNKQNYYTDLNGSPSRIVTDFIVSKFLINFLRRKKSGQNKVRTQKCNRNLEIFVYVINKHLKFSNSSITRVKIDNKISKLWIQFHTRISHDTWYRPNFLRIR